MIHRHDGTQETKMKKSGMVVLCAALLAASVSAFAEGPRQPPVKEPQLVHKTHKPIVHHQPAHHKAKPVPVHHKVKPKPEMNKPEHRG